MFWIAFAATYGAACGGESGPELEPRNLPSPADVRGELTGLPFEEFARRSYERLLERSPEAVIDLHLEAELDVGRGHVDDISDPFVAETQELESVLLEMVRTYSEPTIAREVYEWWLDDRVRGHEFSDLEYRLSASVNSVTANTELFFTDVHPLDTADDAEKYVLRLWNAGKKIEQLLATLKRLNESGIYHPRLILELAEPAISSVARVDPKGTPYYLALQARFPAGARQDLMSEAEEAIEESIQPAYRELSAWLEETISRTPDLIGASALPNGQAYYLWALRHHVTSDVTPDQLHQLGLDELERIHQELNAAFADRGYSATATLRQNIVRAATDGGIVPRAQVVREYESIIADAQTRLSEAFDLLPSSEVVVKGVANGGFYVSPSLDGSRPGAFFASAFGDEARFGMRTLAYHEALPGHHLQIGIAQDLDLPLFQRIVGFTGFAEGWGLYAEWLAGDLGWYADDPFGDIGRLQAEAFRAARLVVDTGMHAKGWTLDQATQFFMDNVGYSQGAANAQMIRYIAWPGQATAYYTGRAKILELRREVEARDGMGFDVKAFHRSVLGHGSVPLGVLERIIRGELH